MANDGKLHVAMLPWLAFGHMIPYLELAKLIAQKGHKVSFISTTRNIDRLPKLPPSPSTPPINFVKLTLPPVSGLPENAEATMDVHNDDYYLKKAFDGIKTELTRFLENSALDWIIYDFATHWLPPITAKLSISSGFLSIFNAWFIAFLGSSQDMINGSDERTTPEDFLVPPRWVKFPTRVAYRLYEANWIYGASKLNASGVSDLYRLGTIISRSDAIFIRHSNEFEPEWLNLLEELHGKPVIPLGLMPPSVQDNGDDNSETWVTIREWLGRQNKESVIYLALGSEVRLSQVELNELALGLELSGLPFFWALRKPPGLIELPDGFQDRTEGQGVVWTTWAPQLQILAHDSVGGFLTHCGWGSIIEGLMYGHPLVMLPFLVDQGLNARVMADKKVGLEVPRDERDGSFTRDSVAETLKLVMTEDEGKTYRDKAKETSAIFADSSGQHRYIDRFLEYLENHRRLLKG